MIKHVPYLNKMTHPRILSDQVAKLIYLLEKTNKLESKDIKRVMNKKLKVNDLRMEDKKIEKAKELEGVKDEIQIK